MSGVELHPLSVLDGQEIVRWFGTEMALTGGEPEGSSHTPLLWEHDSVPYLQLTEVDIGLASGRIFRILAQMEDGTGYHGFYMMEAEVEAPREAEEGSPFRRREIAELPLGVARLEVLRQDGPNAVVEIALILGSDIVTLLAAEVYERDGGVFEVLDLDESVLIQLNGKRPRVFEAWRIEEMVQG